MRSFEARPRPAGSGVRRTFLRDNRILETTPGPSASPTTRRTGLHRSLWLRVLTTVLLVAFVCLIGDVRRKRTATAQMDRYAQALNKQIGDSGVLPMNLDPTDVTEAAHQTIDMETLSRSDVRCLRNRHEPILVAWTVRLVQVVGVNARAVVLFEKGLARASWMSLADFDRVWAHQQAVLHDCE